MLCSLLRCCPPPLLLLLPPPPPSPRSKVTQTVQTISFTEENMVLTEACKGAQTEQTVDPEDTWCHIPQSPLWDPKSTKHTQNVGLYVGNPGITLLLAHTKIETTGLSGWCAACGHTPALNWEGPGLRSQALEYRLQLSPVPAGECYIQRR
jgi:hypothetical protein